MILWRPEWGEYPFPCHLLEGSSVQVATPFTFEDLETAMEGVEMDRDSELAKDYTYMSNLVERLERRKTLKVEGQWYLFESSKELPFVISAAILADANFPLEKMKNLGYTVTPVNVFREDGS